MICLFGFSHTPDSTLAGELLFDFVVNKVQNRTYNAKQYTRTRYTEPELRKYFFFVRSLLLFTVNETEAKKCL